MIKTKHWIFLIAALLAASAVACGLLFFRPAAGSVAVVTLDGAVVYTVDLSKVDAPYDYEIASEFGRNTLHIAPGKLCVSDADCPDGVCVRAGWLKSSAPIVCLPHRLVIRLEDGSPATDGIDAVSS